MNSGLTVRVSRLPHGDSVEVRHLWESLFWSISPFLEALASFRGIPLGPGRECRFRSVDCNVNILCCPLIR